MLKVNAERISEVLAQASELAMKVQSLALSISIAAHRVSTSLTDLADTVQQLKIPIGGDER